jgi:hypothetical protein
VSADVPSGTVDDFAHMWAWFATHCQETSPLYERISLAVSGDRDLLERLRAARPSAHLPPALLAAVHYLVLSGADHPLADLYAGRAGPDPGPLFLDFCRGHWEEVNDLLSTRHIQTNDCGRSALIAPGLTWLTPRLSGRFSLIDVGASAGLSCCATSTASSTAPSGLPGPPIRRSPFTAGLLAVNPDRGAAPRFPLSRRHRPLADRSHRPDGRALATRLRLARLGPRGADGGVHRVGAARRAPCHCR